MPQVAAHGDLHLRVSKGTGADGRALTSWDLLDDESARVEEICDMLGLGEEKGRESAAKLIAAAVEERESLSRCGGGHRQQATGAPR